MLTARLRLSTPRIINFSGYVSPGKTEVSLEQWYHEFQCIEDHYPESVVWESIIRSLKGTVSDMAPCIGPTTSVAHILWKLSVIFGTVASIDALMQNFYKVTQGNKENVPSFAIRDLNDAQLSEALEELQLETARREGMAPQLGSPLGQWWAPVVRVNADLDDGEVAFQGGGDGNQVRQYSGPQAPVKQRRMLVTSSAHSQSD